MGKITITFLIIALLLFLGGKVMHEQAHVEIFKSYGIDSKVEYFSHFPRAVTIPEENCPTETCEIQHNLNDIVFYNLNFLFSILTFGFAGIIYVLEDKIK